MNKKGVTIIELLISISMISIVLLLLLRVMLSLENINNDESYASSDEIKRTEVIKNIESDFLNKGLMGVYIDNKTILFKFKKENKELVVDSNYITYDNVTYTLKSKNASYGCVTYSYQELDSDYYLFTITIPVLIDDKNTTKDDDILLTYIGLKDDNISFTGNYAC